jgi:hypothetical protein
VLSIQGHSRNAYKFATGQALGSEDFEGGKNGAALCSAVSASRSKPGKSPSPSMPDYGGASRRRFAQHGIVQTRMPDRGPRDHRYHLARQCFAYAGSADYVYTWKLQPGSQARARCAL